MNNSLKTILGIIIFLISITRLAMKCSSIHKNDSIQNHNNQTYHNNSHEDIYDDEQINYLIAEAKSKSQSLKNNFLYHSHSELENMENSHLKAVQVTKTKNDTTLFIDLKTKFKLEKNSFLQKVYSDSLQYAIKTPDNVLMLIHNFETTKSEKENLESIKYSKNIININSEIFLKSINILTYEMKHLNKVLKGCAISSQDRDKQFFIEFESDSKTKKQLKEIALNFLSNRILLTSK